MRRSQPQTQWIIRKFNLWALILFIYYRRTEGYPGNEINSAKSNQANSRKLMMIQTSMGHIPNFIQTECGLTPSMKSAATTVTSGGNHPSPGYGQKLSNSLRLNQFLGNHYNCHEDYRKAKTCHKRQVA